MVSVCRRCASVGVQTGRAIGLAGDGKGLACPLRGDVVEASTVAVEHRLLASKLLPALHRNIDISRRDLNRVADAAGHLSRDYRRARAAERLVVAVVMAAADREVVFGPNDLRAGLEAAGG